MGGHWTLGERGSRISLTLLILAILKIYHFPYITIGDRSGPGYSVCVSLFYVIDTGSTGSRARHHVTSWGVPIYTHHP